MMAPRLRHGLQQALFGWLNLILTAPSVYLWLGLPLIMRQHGWSGLDIGLFQLAGLPALFKFALAAPVERLRGARGHYRNWSVALCLTLAALLMLTGRRELLGSRAELFALAFGAALLATWADIPVNALAIRLLPASQRLRAGGIRSAALSLGAVAGGGLMLLVQTRWGWRAPFWLMAALLVSGAAGLFLLREPPAAAPPAWAGASLQAEVRGYFGQPAARRWSALLMLCFPFIACAWFYLKPLLLDHGFAAPQVALLVGVGGGLCAAVAGVAWAGVTRRIGIARALPVTALASLCALLALAAMVGFDAGPAALAACALLVALAMGANASLAFALMMYFTRAGHDASDYGIQASLFAASRLVLPPLAGVLVDRHGYTAMLLFLGAAMALVTALAFWSRRALARVAAAG